MSRDKLQFLSPLFLKYQSEFEKNPRSRVFAPLAESYRKVGMLDKALDILSQGIRYNPNYVMGYLGLAYCYFDMKQHNLAYTTLRPLVDSNRDNIRLQKLFADICIEMLRKDEALETLKYLLFLNPKDKEVANLVTSLEKELEEKYKPIHNPIIIPEEVLTDNTAKSVLFDVSKLESTPKIDFDDWIHVDLNQKEKASSVTKEQSLDEWNVTKITPKITMPSAVEEIKEVQEEPKIIKIPTEDLLVTKKEEVVTPNQESPIVTHTLVDLYCGQGHIEKALEILEKILILNPHDQKTKEKISEIKALMAPFNEEPTLEIEEEIVLEQDEKEYEFQIDELALAQETKNSKSDDLIDLEDLDNVSEEDGRRNLMNILDQKILSNLTDELEENHIVETNALENKADLARLNKIEAKLNLFLKRIKERALDYQARF